MSKYNGGDNLEVMKCAVNYNKFLHDLVKSGTRRGDKILDFGAGVGTFAKLLRDDGYDVVCLEVDPLQAQGLREDGFKVYLSINDVESDYFDYIYSLNVLEHIQDDIGVVVSLYEKLGKEGRLFIYVPAMQHLYSSMDKKVGHYRRYTIKSLIDVVAYTPMEMIEIAYADSLGYFATLAYKLFGSEHGDIDTKTVELYDKRIFPMSRFIDKYTNRYFGKNVYIHLLK